MSSCDGDDADGAAPTTTVDPSITPSYDGAVLLRQLEYLTALDRERHFGRAAQTCHVSQPALSAALARLEDELGVSLVRRGQRFEGFTPEGERVLVWARRALADAEGLAQEVQRLRDGLQGTLRLGAIPTSLSASIHVTSRFRRRHPLMRIEIWSMSSREIAAGLQAGSLDAGLTYLDNEPLTDVHTLALWHERYLLVCTGESAAAATTTWAAAAELPLCLLTSDMQHRRIVDAAFAAAGATPRPVIETNSVSTLIAHARTGLPGVTADTWLLAHPLPGELRSIPLVDPVVEHTIGLVARAKGHRSPVVAELMASFEPLELDSHLAVLPSG
jgi:DNA-binding transcriptional LysR family regulator